MRKLVAISSKKKEKKSTYPMIGITFSCNFFITIIASSTIGKNDPREKTAPGPIGRIISIKITKNQIARNDFKGDFGSQNN